MLIVDINTGQQTSMHPSCNSWITPLKSTSIAQNYRSELSKSLILLLPDIAILGKLEKYDVYNVHVNGLIIIIKITTNYNHFMGPLTYKYGYFDKRTIK